MLLSYLHFGFVFLFYQVLLIEFLKIQVGQLYELKVLENIYLIQIFHYKNKDNYYNHNKMDDTYISSLFENEGDFLLHFKYFLLLLFYLKHLLYLLHLPIFLINENN